LADEGREERADNAENGRQNEAGRLIGARHDEFRDNAGDETNDDCPDDAHDAHSCFEGDNCA
jgi:hypothetical protein